MAATAVAMGGTNTLTTVIRRSRPALGFSRVPSALLVRASAGSRSCLRQRSFRQHQHSRRRQAPSPSIIRAGARVVCSATNGVEEDVENVVIIGSGPAGYTAAIYTGRANLRPFVFEGLSAGGVRGGQLMTTTEVENFPGFPEGITGPDLMDRMRAQSERWGAVLETEDVTEVDFSVRPFVIKSAERTVKAHSVIIATGATAKRLGIPSEEKFWSNGISACAICDGASPIFKGQELAVVGGGDTATEEAVYLTKYAKHVHLLVRGEMRASKTMQDRVLRNPNVTVHIHTGIVDAVGNNKNQMTALRLKDTRSGEERDLPVRGLFYGIGHKPNSGMVKGQIELDEAGYVVVQHGIQTSVRGVFAAGDLHDTEWRQAITAAGSGCQAAIAAERYLSEEGLGKTVVAEEKEEAKPAPQTATATTSAPTETVFDIVTTRHSGQFALRKLYHESDRLIMVCYTSPTCGPCRTLKPILNKIVDEYDRKIHFVDIDIEQDPEIAEAAGVNGTPTVQVFKNKERLHNLPGVKMKGDYRKIIDPHVEAPVKVGV